MRTVALWLSLIAIFTIPWEAIIVLPGLGTVTRGTGLLVAAFWAFAVMVSGKFRKPRLFHLLALAFLLWNVMSSFWTLNVDDTLKLSKTYAQLLLFSLILWDLYTTPANLRMGLQAYVLGAYVSIISTVYNYFVGRAFSNYTDRFGAVGFNVNDLGLVLALGIPIAWHLAAFEGHNKWAFVVKLVNYGYIPAGLLGIALTGSRGSMIAVFPALLYILGGFRRLRLLEKLLVSTALTLALVWLLSRVPTSTIQRLSTAGTSIAQGDVGGRVAIWREGVEGFLEHPLLGVGSAGFQRAVPSGLAPHNVYLSVLVDLGIIGLGLLALILATTVSQVLQLPKSESRFWLTVFAVWFLGSLTLGWAYAKPTWLFLSLAVVAGGFSVQHVESVHHSASTAAVTVATPSSSSLSVPATHARANQGFISREHVLADEEDGVSVSAHEARR